MNHYNALEVFLDFCNRNYDLDMDGTQESYFKGLAAILSSFDKRFLWCRNRVDVFREIHWPKTL